MIRSSGTFPPGLHMPIATVIATFGRRMRIALPDDSTAEARIKGKSLRPVCGDQVRVQDIENEADLLITGIEPRRNALTRPNQRGSTEVLAANVDLLIVVAAASPVPDWFIVDRYLCAAELMPAEAKLVFNKADAPAPPGTDAALAVYRQIGYDVHRTSVELDTTIADLRRSIGLRTAILVGQSGVGKSTLINRLSEPSAQRTSGISRKTGEGRHTTVNSVMLPLAGGGVVIDSPGVRDFAPGFRSVKDVQPGFREIHAAAYRCRFANCQHLLEPGCAVKDAVDSGTIDARRYESYRRALRLVDRLQRRSH